MSVLLLTVYLAIFMLYRFATVFLNRGSLRQELFYKYYKSNLSHMKKHGQLNRMFQNRCEN